MYAAQSLLLLGELLTYSPGHPVLHSSCDVSNLGGAAQEGLSPPGLAMKPSHSIDDQATRSFSSQHRPALKLYQCSAMKRGQASAMYDDE